METSAYGSAPTTISMKTDNGNGPFSGKSEVQEYYERRRQLEQLITVMAYEEKGEEDTVGQIYRL